VAQQAQTDLAVEHDGAPPRRVPWRVGQRPRHAVAHHHQTAQRQRRQQTHAVIRASGLRPHPRSGIVPLPAEPVDLDVHDSYTTVPGMPGSLGAVLDHDTANLAAQTRGFKASKKRGQTLGNYQEVRARHLHSMVRRHVAEGSNSPPNEERATR
jgi:hypothetical protein